MRTHPQARHSFKPQKIDRQRRLKAAHEVAPKINESLAAGNRVFNVASNLAPTFMQLLQAAHADGEAPWRVMASPCDQSNLTTLTISHVSEALET